MLSIFLAFANFPLKKLVMNAVDLRTRKVIPVSKNNATLTFFVFREYLDFAI